MYRLATVVLCLVLGGCAFTVHDVQTNYHYSAPASTRLPSKQMEVGKFSDERGMQNPRMIMNMTNMNGNTTSGGWQAEKPLSELLRDGVIEGLTSAGVAVQHSDGTLVLKGQLLDFSVKTIMGWWEGSYKGKMTAKFQLVDSSTDTVMWQDTFIGRSQVKGSKGAVGVLNATLDDLVTKLLSDKYFQQKLAE